MSSHSSRGSRVRTKVVALLVSMAALWAFAAYVTLRDGTNLLSLTTFAAKVGKPSEDMVANLQKERRASLVFLADSSAAHRDALNAQRELTDQTAATYATNVADTTVRWLADDALKQRFADVTTRLGGLAQSRASIDAGAMDRTRAAGWYTDLIDAAFRIYGSLVTLDDEQAAKRGRALVNLSRATELLSQEDALLAGALTANRISPAEHAQFIQLVGTQRYLYRDAIADLPVEDQARYAALAAGESYQRFSRLEDEISRAQATGAPPPVTPADWDVTVAPMLAQERDAILKATDHGLELATPIAIWVIIRLILAGGLGLLAVIASIVISITTARALVKQLERLRNAAFDLASYRLPRVVQRLQHGEKVDVDNEAPPLDFGKDEIGQVGQAFNDVQSTAIRVAVEQAELRRSVRDVFLSLARRSQALLHRQLGLLDVMERRATDAEELAELFRIDHLATRMRRNAENLIVLSGATAGRAWRRPVPMVDVLRGALAEVEDYTRVTVLPVVPASLVGRAVGDVIHLLAELIENAVSFSPPQTVVRVGGSAVGNGFAIEIEDRGLGMSEADRDLANQQLAEPPEFKLSSTARLGLYVVGKLAERHGIRVKLTESPYGGTTAIVLLPATLMADGLESSVGDGVRPEPLDAADLPDAHDGASLTSWAALTPGRHRHDAPAEFDVVPVAAGTALPVRPSASAKPDQGAAAADAADLDEPSSADGYTPRPFVTLSTRLDDNGNVSHAVPNVATSDDAASTGALTNDALSNGALSNGALSNGALSNGALSNGARANGARPNGRRSPRTEDVPAPTIDGSVLDRPSGAVTLPVELTGGEPVILTPSGLPWRQRDKGGLKPPSVATGAPAHTRAPVPPAAPTDVAATETDSSGRTGRPPEQVRSIMASYRSGTLRGRIDAARLAEPATAATSAQSSEVTETSANGGAERTDPTRDPHSTDEEG